MQELASLRFTILLELQSMDLTLPYVFPRFNSPEGTVFKALFTQFFTC